VGEEAGGVLRIGDAAGDEDAGGERIDAELDREAPDGAPLRLDVSISTRKDPAQPNAPLVQTPVVANVRSGVV
jgi:hypothetical protein